MRIINSENILDKLTHVTSPDGAAKMIKNGIKVKDMGDAGLLYKPPGFWISMNEGWERWTRGNDFQNDKSNVILDVKLKPGLRFARVSSITDAETLIRYLVPDIPQYEFSGFHVGRSDLLNVTHYMLEAHKQGLRLTAKMLWKKVLDNYDGVYYEDSETLHMRTMFNAWDVSSIVIFDPRNITLIWEI